ncbi:MAG TPA: protein kinase [Blastocatellia bacterium]|nr:protein kinase [Blastocatellia bacterium]
MIGYVVGNYRITEKIGEGGMGAVFKGIDMMLEREVAIKMLRPELASQPQVVERFRSEAVTLAKLNHPNIATLYSFLRQGEDFFMVMEFVRGETLDNVIRKHGAMSIERAIAMFCQALEGIEHAHRLDIIHRDIKPANMMLTDTGTIKVMDFGIARVLGTSRLTRQGNIVGTIEYMSPEQVRGEETDARSDIYSLGILLYEMLTGRVPFQSDSEFALMKSQIEDAPTPPRTFAMHIPIVVEQAIMRALAKKPEMRYKTAAEFRAALLQGIGAVATISDPAKPAYAAPATRVADAYAAPPTVADAPRGTGPTPDHIKETVIVPQGPGTPLPPAADHLKATRLNDPAGVQASYPVPQQAAYPPPNQYSTSPINPQGQTSLLGRLNWKHYTAAAVALLVLITVPLALIVSRSNQAASPPVTAQPASADTAPAPQPSPQPSPQEQPLPAPATQTAPIADESAPATGATDSSKSARQRDSRTERAGQTETSAETPATSKPVASEPPQPAPAPKEEKPAVAETKPAEEKKEEKKKGGFFGKVKKIFGGGDDDKKKNENKNKKP